MNSSQSVILRTTDKTLPYLLKGDRDFEVPEPSPLSSNGNEAPEDSEGGSLEEKLPGGSGAENPNGNN